MNKHRRIIHLRLIKTCSCYSGNQLKLLVTTYIG